MRSIALSLLAGVLVVAGFPPFNWAPVAWAGVALWLYAWRTASSARVAAWSGFAGGAVFFGGLFWWLVNVELIAFWPLVIVQSLFVAFPAWAAWTLRPARHWQWVMGVAGAWGLAEAARVRAPFGGFPWGVIGLTVDLTPLRPSAQWIGATGWSVVIVAVAAVAVLAVVADVSLPHSLLVPGLAVALGVAGLFFPATPGGPTLSVVVVQGNSPCPGSSCPNERLTIFENHLALTRALEPGTYDLVIWPESATGFASDPISRPEFAELIAAEARRLDAYVLVGGDRPAGDRKFINANLLFDPTGTLVAEYRKTHPVPFGEYVPLRRLLEWIPALDRVPRDMVRGDGPVTLQVEGQPVGSVISYEGAFARYPRAAVRAGAGLVVVATNEASFGDSPAADQFIAMSRLRAAENGVDVIHAAVTGKSAILHADGSVDGPTRLFTSEVLPGRVSVRTAGPTLYTRWGDWLQALAAVAFLAIVAVRVLGSQRAADVPAGRPVPVVPRAGKGGRPPYGGLPSRPEGP